MDNGADVNARTADGGNALLAAAFFGESNIARMLLDAGADATASNRRRQTVWDVAAQDWRRSKAVAKRFKLQMERDAVLAGRAEILAMVQPELNALAQENAWVAAAVGDVEASAATSTAASTRTRGTRATAPPCSRRPPSSASKKSPPCSSTRAQT